MLSHQNLQCQSLTLIRAWRLFDDYEVNLCASALFHIASIGAIAPMVLIGGTTVLLPSGGFGSAATLELMEAERITSVFLVPTSGQTAADPSRANRDLSALKTMSWGAAPATTTLLARMAEVVSRRYQRGRLRPDGGLSPVTCALSGADALRKIGSVGKPVSIVAARIVDDDMKDVLAGKRRGRRDRFYPACRVMSPAIWQKPGGYGSMRSAAAGSHLVTWYGPTRTASCTSSTGRRT